MSYDGGQGGIPLMYESPAPGRISAVRQGTWITLLILGILTILLGLCMGGSVVFVLFMMKSRFAAGPGGAGGPAMPANFELILWALGAAYLVIPTVTGTIEIICSVKIRKGSRAAEIVAAVVVGLQLLLALGIVATAVVVRGIRGEAARVCRALCWGYCFILRWPWRWA